MFAVAGHHFNTNVLRESECDRDRTKNLPYITPLKSNVDPTLRLCKVIPLCAHQEQDIGVKAGCVYDTRYLKTYNVGSSEV